MKRTKLFTCWTDYPIAEIPNKKIHHVQVISYDGDKYVTVRVIGYDVVMEIKSGYLYSNCATYKYAKFVNRRKILRMINSKL